jgi:hypothetical protein
VNTDGASATPLGEDFEEERAMRPDMEAGPGRV